MASSINTKTINKLLKLYRQLIKLITSEPSKNKDLWEQSLAQAEKEYINELKEHEKQLSSRTPPLKVSIEEKKEFEKAFQHITTKNAEKKYRQMDSNYSESILKKEKKMEELIKEVDHFQYSINDQLIEFDRAHGTLLLTNWQKLKQILPIFEITSQNFQFYIEKSIDALEAIKCKVKKQQSKISQRITTLFWKLYETTLKIFLDVIIERFHTK